jgi:tRNA threonylcarbamoyl adenosine modification protein YeaZ
MMLYIDVSDSNTARIGLVDSKRVEDFTWETSNNLSETLLDKITELLKKQELTFRDLTKLGVVVGPGHFSRIRSGVTTANALAFALNIKVIGVLAGTVTDWRKLYSKTGVKMVKPVYGREPNITKAKKKKLNF